jgi:hypothetical protein
VIEPHRLSSRLFRVLTIPGPRSSSGPTSSLTIPDPRPSALTGRHVGGDEANCLPALTYASSFSHVLALDDDGFLLRQYDLSHMRNLGVRLLIASSSSSHDAPSSARGRVRAYADVLDVHATSMHVSGCPLAPTLSEHAASGTPVDCVLLRCPPTAEACEAFFQAMLLCTTQLGACQLAPHCQARHRHSNALTALPQRPCVCRHSAPC